MTEVMVAVVPHGYRRVTLESAMTTSIDRRMLLATLLAGAGGGAWAQARPRMAVYKSPSCGCCMAWVTHIEKAGLQVTVVQRDDLEGIKRTAGVPDALQSCHTAFIDGYVVEGHVPAAAIERLLRERPAVIGLSVPGMPIGSPGMETPGQRPEPFAVMTIPLSGAPAVFVDYPKGYGT
jgi:hypothetical protein